MDEIPILIMIMGFILFGIGCTIDCIIAFIMLLTGIILVSAKVYIIIMGAPILSAPVLSLLSAFIIWLLRFFID